MTSDLAFMGLVEVGRRIAERQVSSEEVTRAQLERIARVDPAIGSYVAVLPEQALAEAKARDAALQQGRGRGPLHGVPVAVKDLCDLAGTATTAGFPMFRDNRAASDSTVVARLRAAGAVILGKLHLTEGALALHHPEIKPPVNPWRRDLWSGASSSGSGAATAAGLCYGSLGSDTGGSIRFPSNCNALVGLKPTWGRVSRHGVAALSDTLDHVGPMTRRVEDAAAMLGAIAGRDPADPTSSPQPVPDYLLAAATGVRGLRVGYDAAHCNEGVAPPIARAIAEALDLLRRQGAEVREIAMPAGEAAIAAWGTLCATEAAMAHDKTYPARREGYSEVFRGFLDAGRAVSGVDYARATVARRAYGASLAQLFEGVDVIIAPITAGMVPTVEAFNQLCAEPDGLTRLVSRTCLYDSTGSPVLTLPAGLSDDGIPVGFQLVGRAFEEATLCRAGLAYQEARNWRATPRL
jgi:amidase